MTVSPRSILIWTPIYHFPLKYLRFRLQKYCSFNTSAVYPNYTIKNKTHPENSHGKLQFAFSSYTSLPTYNCTVHKEYMYPLLFYDNCSVYKKDGKEIEKYSKDIYVYAHLSC